MSAGRTVQRARSESSIWESVGDHMPIFRMRLVDERGERSTGGRATLGRFGAVRVTRS